jgi:ABC-type Fe3+ transport system permease subunit
VNRPFWLDILYVGCFLVPPVVIAAAITVALARWMGWSGLVMGFVYVVSALVSIVLWVAGLVLWSRLSPKSPRAGRTDPDT